MDDRLAESGAVHAALDGALERFHLVGGHFHRLAGVGVEQVRLIDEVDSALQVKPQAKPKRGFPAALEVAEGYSLESEREPGGYDDDGD